MQIQIDLSSCLPIYLQIVNQVKYLATSGRLGPGEEIPAIRRLAENLMINPNTVARAYVELENVGVGVIRHGAVTYVSQTPPAINRNRRHKILGERIDILLSEARQLGVELKEVVTLLQLRHKKMTFTD